MKVRIGKYKSWIGPYQLAEKIMFWVPKEKDEHGFPHTADRVHRFGEWLAYGSIRPEKAVGDETDLFNDKRSNTWLYRFLMWIDSKKKRQVYVHIDCWDTWSMDSTLGYIIRPMLYQLKATKHGSPFVDDKDVPDELKSTSAPPKENDYDTDDNHHLRWEWALGEMIWAFEQKCRDHWEDDYTTGEYDFQFVKVEDGEYKGYSQMVEGTKHTAVTDWDGRKAHQERMSNGFRLFGKYYEALWD